MTTSFKAALISVAICLASASDLFAQCSQDISAVFSNEHKTEILIHYQATSACPVGGQVRLFLSLDGGSFTEVQDCNVSQGQICERTSQGAVECACGCLCHLLQSGTQQ